LLNGNDPQHQIVHLEFYLRGNAQIHYRKTAQKQSRREC